MYIGTDKKYSYGTHIAYSSGWVIYTSCLYEYFYIYQALNMHLDVPLLTIYTLAPLHVENWRDPPFIISIIACTIQISCQF